MFLTNSSSPFPFSLRNSTEKSIMFSLLNLRLLILRGTSIYKLILMNQKTILYMYIYISICAGNSRVKSFISCSKAFILNKLGNLVIFTFGFFFGFFDIHSILSAFIFIINRIINFLKNFTQLCVFILRFCRLICINRVISRIFLLAFPCVLVFFLRLFQIRIFIYA